MKIFDVLRTVKPPIENDSNDISKLKNIFNCIFNEINNLKSQKRGIENKPEEIIGVFRKNFFFEKNTIFQKNVDFSETFF